MEIFFPHSKYIQLNIIYIHLNYITAYRCIENIFHKIIIISVRLLFSKNINNEYKLIDDNVVGEQIYINKSEERYSSFDGKIKLFTTLIIICI